MYYMLIVYFNSILQTPYARIRSGSSNTFNHTTTFSQELNAVSIP
ncbi:unnamed protein product, partial [Rotaria magnacalcarata]